MFMLLAVAILKKCLVFTWTAKPILKSLSSVKTYYLQLEI